MNDSRSENRSEVTLRSLSDILWRDKTLLVIITSICTVAATIGALVSQKDYKAQLVFSVASDDRNGMGGGAGSMLSQFGAIASLAGVSIGGNTQKSEPIAVLQSRYLTEQFIEVNNLLPVLFEKKWDSQSGQWIDKRPSKIPTLWKGDEEFKKIRTVLVDAKTGLVTLSITWHDPELAATWANGLVEMTNRQLREKAIREAQRNIAYLKDQASKTDLVPVRTALSTLMEDEFKQSMVAGGNEEYALKVIDPAIKPESPSSLRRIFVVLGGFLGGLFIAIFAVFMRASWRGER
jgi:uncharacterized protein involved in exopolysaccharide biosynthesis